MDLSERLGWPFFGPEHRALANLVTTWAAGHLSDHAHGETRAQVDEQARKLVAALGAAGITRYCVRAEHGGALDDFDSRAICLIRETLAYHDGLADFAFAMQGLGSGALSLAGERALQQQYLPHVAAGTAISAFALSEPDAGSDVAAMQTSARLDGGHYVLNGTKTWISNGGIADVYCVFARTSPGEKRADGTVSAQGITAFLVEPTDPGFEVEQRIDVIAPHPLGRLRLENCRIPVARRIGAEGDGFKLAMRTLDIFRASVAAAALGFARRAFDEAVAYSRQRAMFGKTLADFQLTQAAIAEMATAIDAAALLTYRAAWQRDTGQPVTKTAAMAKMTATESAQTVIDRAVQMFGGRGVVHGEVVERLYRDIRALRIYEGATEVQKLIIAREVLK
ncbi:acyl-CoA dehydrogenase family protein [Steroidobacter gossypii]|uniref:acyl-CoA dehydrogenase family protein n=1 Tax=Steroidobacter gossypii TaxID=2805490 RepID=UPI00389B209E